VRSGERKGGGEGCRRGRRLVEGMSGGIENGNLGRSDVGRKTKGLKKMGACRERIDEKGLSEGREGGGRARKSGELVL